MAAITQGRSLREVTAIMRDGLNFGSPYNALFVDALEAILATINIQADRSLQ
ncbi:MAG: hypothetical protein INF88_00485 [Roseomonas sp.]|nr:hypothetical protein [Roseomonas sp.]